MPAPLTSRHPAQERHGLDIYPLKVVPGEANSHRGVLVVTHGQRLLDYIEPDFVHVILEGGIVKSRDKPLALELEEKGYDWVEKEVQQLA